MKIKKVSVKQFRGFHNQKFRLGNQITAIAGQNGTQKSTLLGMITQTFTIGRNKSPMYGEKPLCGGSYKSAFQDKFRLSPNFDKPKEHEWTLSFDNNIPDFTVESIKRSKNGNIRFWKKGSRKEGDGYIQYPTIFLSLKRVLPLAEAGNKLKEMEALSQEEVEEFTRLHDLIMITQSEIEKVTILNTVNKQTVGINTKTYDWNENSVGQDNLSKILLALFSFKRLKEKYKNDYQGGILAIDELDATMYPASQTQLLQTLRKYSSKYNIQIVFTTHSMSLLESVDDMRRQSLNNDSTKVDIRIVYLSKVDGKVIINDEATFYNMTLNLKVIQNQMKKKKITVYTEDKENKILARYLLQQYKSELNFINVDFSCSHLIGFVQKKVPAFIEPQAIVILDGDVRKNHENMNKISNAKNVLILPTNMSPEQLVASYLNGLSEADELWESINSGYSKQVCFRNYIFAEIMTDRAKAKQWFNRELKSWGTTGGKVLRSLFECYNKEKDEFLEKYRDVKKHFIL